MSIIIGYVLYSMKAESEKDIPFSRQLVHKVADRRQQQLRSRCGRPHISTRRLSGTRRDSFPSSEVSEGR
jgi:hypothetical protein